MSRAARLPGALTAGTLGAGRSGPVAEGRLFARLSAAPDTYRLRVAVVDETGRGGNADYLVAAELQQIGSIHVGSLVASGAGGSPGPLFEASGERAVMTSLEIYGDCRAGVEGVIEIAETPNGPALERVPLAIAATAEADRCVASAVIPIADLEAGDYSLRAVLSAEGRAAGRILQTLRIR